jgi:hypothetical protein
MSERFSNGTYIRSAAQVHENESIVDVFRDPPMASFRHPRNLKDMVARTRLKNPQPKVLRFHDRY